MKRLLQSLNSQYFWLIIHL